MVRRFLGLVYKEIRGLHQAAYVLALFTFSSQLLALVRDRLLANQFGAGVELDIYYAAFRIPDLLFVLFASTLSVYVLIPFVARRMEDGGAKRAQALLSHVFSVFLVGYSALALVIALNAPSIVGLIFPGFSGEEAEVFVLLLRIMLIQPFFLGLSSLFGVITQLHKRFVLFALSPVLYNVGIILGIVLIYPHVGLWGLALGVVLGAVLHMSVQIPFVKGSGLIPHFTLRIPLHELKEVFVVSIPRALTLSLHQILFVVLVGIASVMAVGSVSVLQFAFNLQSVPLAIIGVSYSVAAFPTLAMLFSKGMREDFRTHISAAIKHILFWSVPATALLIVLRAHVVRVILGTGAFDWDDTRLTAAVLGLFLISLVAQAINLVLVRGFYAAGNTRTPLVVAAISTMGTLLLASLLFALFSTSAEFARGLEALMRVAGVSGSEVLTLPFAFTLGMTVHSLVLLVIFGKLYALELKSIGITALHSILAAIAVGSAAYIALNLFVHGVRTSTFLGILIQGTLAGFAGIVAGALVLYFLKNEEFFEVGRSFRKRIFKTDVFATDENPLN